MKDNKLIADFMGYRVFGNKCRKPMPYSLKGWLVDDIAPMQFHTSWDWLMPVVEKIEKLEVGDVAWTSVYFDIQREYDKAVEFINQHNKTI